MGKRISREELLAEIHRLNDEYGKATTTLMREHGEYSTRTYDLRFGSWSDALEEAGLELNRKQNISNGDLIEELQRLADDLGETPQMSDMDDSGRYSRGVYETRFDSWNDAIKEAGLTPNRHTDISKSDLVSEIQRIVDELGRTPTRKEMGELGKYGSSQYGREFGSWREAVEAAGFEYSRQGNHYSDEDLVEAIQDLAEDDNTPPAWTDMEKEGEVSAKTCTDRFGSWRKALEKAGFDVLPPFDEVPDSALCEELNEIRARLGRTPKYRELSEQSDFPPTWYRRRFGSWNNALIEAGIQPNQRRNIPDEELLEAITSLASDLERTPRQRDMREFGPFGVGVFKSRFDSWNEALREAGMSPVHVHDINESDLVEALVDLADQLGRPPSADGMNENGRFSEAPYFDRFGSWIGALESAGLETPLQFEDVNREQLIDEIHHVSEIVDSVPKVFDIRKHSEMKSAWFAREFGSWNEALRQAGFDPHRNHDITNSELIDELQNVADDLGEAPTVEDFSAHGRYNPSLYISRFNSWNDALREAGIEPGKRHSISEKELEEEFNWLMDVLGYVPSGREMTELGHFSKGVYDDRFGSWNDAVRTFGEEPRFTRSGDGDSQSYGALWEERREEIIQRDGEMCVVCEVNRDTHMEKFGRDFNVHHIIPFLEEYERTGDLEIAHRPENLVTVCVQCHASVEQRSKEYFQELVPDGVLGEADSYSEGESPNTTLDEFL